MAVRKDEAQNAADRAAQQGLGIGQEGERAGEQAADATRRFGEEASRSAEQGRRGAEEMTRNIAQFGRDQAQRTTDAAQQGARQAADMLGASARSYGEIAEQSRGNVEAVIQSSARIARGIQEMGWEVARFGQDSFRSSLQVASEMMHCRSLEDVVQVQSDYVREAMDRALEQQAKLLRLSRAAAEEAEQAISSTRKSRQEARPH